jgi:hypothetical protein
MMRVAAGTVAALGFLIAVSGCDESPSQPQAPFQLSFSAPTSIVGDTVTGPTGGNDCRWRTTATATGGQPGDHAIWTGIEWEARDVSDNSLLGQGTFTPAEVRDYWGSDRIVTGTTQESASWGMAFWVIPWRIEMRFFYSYPRATVTAVSIECR